MVEKAVERERRRPYEVLIDDTTIRLKENLLSKISQFEKHLRTGVFEEFEPELVGIKERPIREIRFSEEDMKWLKKEFEKRKKIANNLEEWQPEIIARLGDLIKEVGMENEVNRARKEAYKYLPRFPSKFFPDRFYKSLKADVKYANKEVSALHPAEVFLHIHNGEDEIVLFDPITDKFGKVISTNEIHILLPESKVNKMGKEEIVKRSLELLVEYFGKHHKPAELLSKKIDTHLTGAIYIKHGLYSHDGSLALERLAKKGEYWQWRERNKSTLVKAKEMESRS